MIIKEENKQKELLERNENNNFETIKKIINKKTLNAINIDEDLDNIIGQI